MPVPVSVEVCGPPTALSLTCNEPERAPVCVGWNTTLMVQLPPPDRLDPQVVAETAKSPVVDAEMLVNELLPLFFSVNVLATLVPPTSVLGKFALAGVNVTCALPVPVSATLCGLPGALSVIVTAPVRVPICVGVNVTLNLQLPPTGSVLPQVLVLMAKSPLAAMLLMFNVALPVFDIFTDLPAEVFPVFVAANVSDVGERLTTGPLPAATVSWIVVVFVRAPDVPLTVTVDVPLVADPLAVNVSVLVELVGFGENPAVTPLGRPVALKLTVPLNPFTGTTVIWLVAVLPCATLTELGFAVRLKSGLATTLTVTGADAMPLATTDKL